MPKRKRSPRLVRDPLTDGIQKAIRFPVPLHDAILALADHDRDFAPYVRRVMQEHVEQKRAEKRAIFAT